MSDSPIVLLDATETALHPQTLVVARTIRDIGLNVDAIRRWTGRLCRRDAPARSARAGWMVGAVSGPAAPDAA